MKKIIALLLAVVMVLGLVACSSSADKTPDTTPAETTDNTPADTTDTETKTDDTAAADTAMTAAFNNEKDKDNWYGSTDGVINVFTK